MKTHRHKDAVEAGDLPAQCRTWDAKRRVWVAKTRYASDKEATAAAPKGQSAYRCKASKDTPHFHLGHPTKGRR